MNAKVKEFILTNKNTNVTWKIDNMVFLPNDIIPNDLLDKHVFDWTVNQLEGIIIITTEYRETVSVYVPKTTEEAKKLFEKFKNMNLEHLDEEKFLFYFSKCDGTIGFYVRDNTWQLIPTESSDLFNVVITEIE